MPAISVYGPRELQAPVIRFIVTPIAQATIGLRRQLDQGVEVVHEIGRRRGWR